MNRLSTHIGGTTWIDIDIANRVTDGLIDAASGVASMTADANGAASGAASTTADAEDTGALDQSS
jgi:hypothetical protein